MDSDQRTSSEARHRFGSASRAGKAMRASSLESGAPDAEVDALPERQVAIGLAFQVEAIRLVEDARVPVRRTEHEIDQLPLGQALTVQLHVTRDTAPAALDGALEAQHLLDGARQQGLIAAQPRQFLGSAQQQQDAVGDEVARGLVTGDEQRRAHRDELGLREPITGLLRFHERSDEVCAGVGPALPAEVAEVVLDGDDGLGRAHKMVVHDRPAGTLDADDAIREPDEQLAVGDGDAHQLGDDDGREGVGEVPEQIGVAALPEARRGAPPR